MTVNGNRPVRTAGEERHDRMPEGGCAEPERTELRSNQKMKESILMTSGLPEEEMLLLKRRGWGEADTAIFTPARTRTGASVAGKAGGISLPVSSALSAGAGSCSTEGSVVKRPGSMGISSHWVA